MSVRLIVSADATAETANLEGRRAYGLPLSAQDIDNFHREIDLIKEARTDMAAARLGECTMPLMRRIFEPDPPASRTRLANSLQPSAPAHLTQFS